MKRTKRWAAMLLTAVILFSSLSYIAMPTKAADADEISEAQAAVEAAQAVIDKGSLGFFEYVGADAAVAILTDDRLADDTVIGDPEDATSLDNMYWAVHMIPICNELRANDPNFTEWYNHMAMTVTDSGMAAAQKQCNGAAALLNQGSTYPHTYAYAGEILAWGYGYKNLTSERGSAGPYNDWYYYERDYYENGGGSSTHYCHMMTAAGATGIGVSQNTTSFQSMCAQVFGGRFGDTEETIFTTEEYVERFDAYYNMVYANLEAAEAALAKAQGHTIATDSLSLSPASTTLIVGETGSLSVRFTPANATERDLTFQSSAPKSVSVDAEGGFTALRPVQGDGDAPGQATITAANADGAKGTARVAVLFQDVTDSSYYYYKPVYWAYNQGITTGRSGGAVFDPSATCTRAEIVTFLWRAAGQPEPSEKILKNNPFGDISEDKYYYKAVLWAYERRITTGRSGANPDGSLNFDPSATCTRREIVTFLWRYAGKKTPSKTGTFTDVQDPTAYYYNAVYWAVEQGITTGKAATDYTTFDPLGECTRGMSVTFIYRYAR